jgi:hypothetical protein
MRDYREALGIQEKHSAISIHEWHSIQQEQRKLLCIDHYVPDDRWGNSRLLGVTGVYCCELAVSTENPGPVARASLGAAGEVQAEEYLREGPRLAQAK